MKRGHGFWITLLVLLLGAHVALAAALSTIVLSVEGMTGGAGPVVVKRALEGLPGVQRAEVSFRDKAARVTYDPARVGVEELIQAVKDAGFRASVKGGD